MICSWCKSGAVMEQSIDRDHLGRVNPNDLLLVLEEHKQCLGLRKDKTWCDCAHVVPGVHLVSK